MPRRGVGPVTAVRVASRPDAGASIEASTDPSCPNCGARGLRRFCADCGQAAPRPTDYAVRAHAAELVEQVASVDGRIMRTLRALVVAPGLLTVEHLAGRRTRYLRPLQLFLLVNVLLFLAAPRMPLFTYSLANYRRYSPPSPALVTTLVQRKTIARRPIASPVSPGSGAPAAYVTAYIAAFDARVEAQRKSLIVLFAPAMALVLQLMFSRHAARAGVPRRYGEHLVFALHTLAFVWLGLAAWGGLVAFNTETRGRFGLGVLVVLLVLALPVYLFHAVRRVYALTTRRSLALTALLAVAFTGLLVLYRGLLFFTTYYTL